MAILIHVLIALGSLGFSTYLFFSPSAAKFRLSYGLVGLTFITGSYLLWTNPAHMVQACISGVSYLGLVFTLMIAARYKLAKSPQK